VTQATILVLSRYADIFDAFHTMVDILVPGTPKILIRSGNEIAAPRGVMWRTQQGTEPFNFSRSANDGFAMASPNDVVLCGDDLRVQTEDFVNILQRVAYSDPKIAVAVPELGGQSIFVCAYIKREILQGLGGLDEELSGYGWQDNDFYRRYEAAGYKTQPTTEVVAEHCGGTSFWRRERETGKRVQDSADAMQAIYERKWGPCAK
jgi:hypothetical protein